jgi:hypothetical protein
VLVDDVSAVGVFAADGCGKVVFDMEKVVADVDVAVTIADAGVALADVEIPVVFVEESDPWVNFSVEEGRVAKVPETVSFVSTSTIASCVVVCIAVAVKIEKLGVVTRELVETWH